MASNDGTTEGGGKVVSGKYILDKDGTPKEETDLLVWAKWFDTADRIVKKTMVGNVRVSTVFLGLDHNFSGGTPILWETMVFGGSMDEHMDRYATRQAALDGHAEVVALVEKGETGD